MAQGTASGLVQVSGSLLEELLTDMRVLVANLGGTFPDTAGRVRVLLDAMTSTVTLATVTTVGNVSSEGGVPANSNVGSFMNTAAFEGIRRQIVVS